jgi:hypothetical protein
VRSCFCRECGTHFDATVPGAVQRHERGECRGENGLSSPLPKPTGEAANTCPHGYRLATRLSCPTCHPVTPAHEANLNYMDDLRQ